MYEFLEIRTEQRYLASPVIVSCTVDRNDKGFSALKTGVAPGGKVVVELVAAVGDP